MDSINKNQVEENKEDLTFSAALRKLKELAEKANSCFFSTSKALGPSHGTRPMSVQEIDDEGNLWFLSANDSFKNKEIAIAPAVSLYFQGSSHADFLFLSGNATISYDKEKIKKLWNPILKTWFTEGIDDPRISIIKFRPSNGYYWDNKNGNAVAGIKMLVGSVIGKTLDDSIEGQLKV